MNYFDRMAGEFDAERKRVDLARDVGDAMIHTISLSPESRVMDYGAGTGLLTLKLQPYVKSIVAVDTSPNMLEVLKEKIERARIGNIETLLWDVETGEDLSDSYDAITGSMVLHHIPSTQNALNRFFQMLRPGGSIALADLDKEEGDFHPPEVPVPHYGFDRDALRDVLRTAGFQNIRFSTPHIVRKPNAAGLEKEYPIFLVVADKK